MALVAASGSVSISGAMKAGVPTMLLRAGALAPTAIPQSTR